MIESLQYYKPSKRGWIAWSIAALSLCGIVYAVCSSNISVKVQSAVQVDVGEGAKTINVIQVQPKQRLAL